MAWYGELWLVRRTFNQYLPNVSSRCLQASFMILCSPETYALVVDDLADACDSALERSATEKRDPADFHLRRKYLVSRRPNIGARRVLECIPDANQLQQH